MTGSQKVLLTLCGLISVVLDTHLEHGLLQAAQDPR